MPTPYNLEVFHKCSDCKIRAERTFCNMSEAGVETLSGITFTSVYPKGSVLFVEGEDPRGVFIICTGKVKLTSSSSEGRTLIVKIAEEGEVLGMSASILGKSYEVSAETIEPSQVNFIRRDDFIRFITENVEACMHTAEQLSDRYHSAQKEIRAFGLAQTTAERLARLLIEWCDTKGEQTAQGTRIQVLLTHEEIAQMIGTSRETVTRLLSDLKKKKVIEVKGASVYVKNREALDDMVTV
ncbi:MAG: Crp/Fnr family transcriptional regulator [Acidobacteria bacterium]|nr:Crp/Fnr family transcriptional regulator [Acidobacteriota bacterium]